MKIMLSNDDGVKSLGINSLYRALNTHELRMIAPLKEQSGKAHAVSINKRLAMKKIDSHIYGVDGYPADTVMVGLTAFYKKKKPDLVISGINHGPNLGQDVYYSGTVGAAREAVFNDIPAIAVSLAINEVFSSDLSGIDVHFETATNLIVKLVANGVHKLIPPNFLLNINVPNLPPCKIKGIMMATLGKKFYRNNIKVKLQDNYCFIEGRFLGHSNEKHTDCAAIEAGKISLTLIDQFGLSSSSLNTMKKFEKFIEKIM